jgi:nitrous oxidase accessory protein NosD
MQARQLRRFAGFTALATLAAVGSGMSPSAQASTGSGVRHVVHDGESIQAAVDRAAPGDTIDILAGTYSGGILITKDDLRISGAGEQTVITPAPDAAAVANACGVAGHGLCVTGVVGHPVAGVQIESLAVSGFAKSGIWGTYTDRMTVRYVTADANGENGIGQENSTRGVLADNIADDNGLDGLFLGDTPDAMGARIIGNHAEGNRLGVHVRRGRMLTIEHNVLTGNCAGVFIVGDETQPVAGAMTISRNEINQNNKFCPANDRIEHIQGSGIVLTGAQDTHVTGNQIRDNMGDSSMSGGIALVPSFSGGPTSANQITDNVVLGNAPSDLADLDETATNTFTRNTCTVSEPAGHC